MADPKPRTPPQLDDPAKRLQDAVTRAAAAQAHAKATAKALYEQPPAESAGKGS